MLCAQIYNGTPLHNCHFMLDRACTLSPIILLHGKMLIFEEIKSYMTLYVYTRGKHLHVVYISSFGGRAVFMPPEINTEVHVYGVLSYMYTALA